LRPRSIGGAPAAELLAGDDAEDSASASDDDDGDANACSMDGKYPALPTSCAVGSPNSAARKGSLEVRMRPVNCSVRESVFFSMKLSMVYFTSPVLKKKRRRTKR